MTYSSIRIQVERDILIAIRGRSETFNSLVFFMVVILLFGLGIGPVGSRLSAVGPAALWVVALFANMLSVEGIFRRDFDDGSLELFLIHNNPLFFGVLLRVSVHWFVTALPLVIVAPLAVVMFNLETDVLVIFVATLLLGTPVLTLIGAIGSALTTGLGKGGMLLALLVLPFYIPVLVFGSSACYAAIDGESVRAQLLWLSVLLVASITVGPFAIAAALRISQEY